MRSATATYHAPEGDSKEVVMGGVAFKDGETVELNSNDHGHMINKLQGNQHFEIDVGEDDGKGRKTAARHDFKGSIESARDHDFEADQRADQARRDGRAGNLQERPTEDLTGKNVAELRQIAEERGIDHEGLSKADLREALSK